MPYQIIEHTADYQILASGKTLEELFTSALAGMMDFLGGQKEELSAQSSKQRKGNNDSHLSPLSSYLSLSTDNSTSLLITFLSEALTLSQINKAIYNEIKFRKLNATALDAEIKGFKVDQFADEIKAVTYHQAKVEQKPNGEWETNIVFDI
jgi:SHS2 domain-containing protein